MKLYIYDHCPYCLRVRLVLAAKKLNHELVIVLNDDEITPISKVGKKMLPILEYGFGMYMPESIDIIDFIDQNFGIERQFSNKNRYIQSDEINQLLEKIRPDLKYLAHPRSIKMPVQEFMTQSAIDYFTKKKQRDIGNFDQAIKNTAEYIKKLEPYLFKLNQIIDIINPKLNLESINIDDVEIFARLRVLYLVESLIIPKSLDHYLRKMSQLTKIALFTEAAC